MGNRQKDREIQCWELDAISNLVNIQLEQLQYIYKDFQRVSKNNLLNKYEFRRVYTDLMRQSSYRNTSQLSSYEFKRQNKTMADRIFRIFNKDHAGLLTFDEFIVAYVMLQNSISPKIRLKFFLDHYSQNYDYITPIMGQQIIQDLSKLYGINTDYQQVWRHLEANYASNSGFIPQQAFIEYFINHPVYSAALYKNV